MSSLTIIVGGDFCPHGPIDKLCREGRAGETFGDMLEVLRDKDLSIVNVECPLTTIDAPIPKSGPNLRCDPVTAEALVAANVDVAVLANNHILDHGNYALKETMDTLDKRGILRVGAGMSPEEASRPLFVERKGVRIGILAYAENEFCNACDLTPGSAPLDPIANIRQIKQARSQCDVLLVTIHGGNEYNPLPSPRVIKTFAAFVEAGASAIIGGHTHTPQGYVWRDGAPIVYSTGNFVFPPLHRRHCVKWSCGYLVKLVIENKKVVEMSPMPFWANTRTGCINRFKPEEEKSFLEHLDHLSGLASDPVEEAKYFDAWCASYGLTQVKRFTQLCLEAPTPQQLKDMLVTRNVIACEAHHEITCRCLELLRLGAFDKAASHVPQLMALRNGPQWLQEKLADPDY